MSKEGWYEALRDAQRQAQLQGELGGGLPSKAGMGAFGVVVLCAGRKRGAGVVQRREQGLVQKLDAQADIKALDEGILGWIVRCDVNPAPFRVEFNTSEHDLHHSSKPS